MGSPDTTRARRSTAAKAIRCAAGLMLVVAIGAGPLAAPEPSKLTTTGATIDVRNPRSFGYVIGDRLEQHVTVSVPPGFEWIAANVPRAGRIDAWLRRDPPRVLSRQSAGLTRYDIALDYQIINVPDQSRTVALPALAFRFRQAGKNFERHVAAWPITITPIIATGASPGGQQTMQPDRVPGLIDTRPLLIRVAACALLLAVIGVCFASDRFGLPLTRRANGPFARAFKDLRHLTHAPGDGAAYRPALQRLHRAFDETAGYALFSEHLERFFADHAELADIREDARRFFSTSQRVFFGRTQDAVIDSPVSLTEVLALAHRGRDAERRAR